MDFSLPPRKPFEAEKMTGNFHVAGEWMQNMFVFFPLGRFDHHEYEFWNLYISCKNTIIIAVCVMSLKEKLS